MSTTAIQTLSCHLPVSFLRSNLPCFIVMLTPKATRPFEKPPLKFEALDIWLPFVLFLVHITSHVPALLQGPTRIARYPLRGQYNFFYHICEGFNCDMKINGRVIK